MIGPMFHCVTLYLVAMIFGEIETSTGQSILNVIDDTLLETRLIVFLVVVQ